MLVLARGDHLAVGGDDLRRDEVVAGESEATGQVADPPTQGEPGDSRGRDDPTGRRETERGRRLVEVAPGRPTLGASGALRRIDGHRPHAGQVGHDAVVDRTEPRDAVAAAAHGQGEPVLTGEVDRSGDVRRIRAPDDDRGPPIDHRVVDVAGLVVTVVARRNHGAADARAQLLDVGVAHEANPSRGRRRILRRTSWSRLWPCATVGRTVRDAARVGALGSRLSSGRETLRVLQAGVTRSLLSSRAPVRSQPNIAAGRWWGDQPAWHGSRVGGGASLEIEAGSRRCADHGIAPRRSRCRSTRSALLAREAICREAVGQEPIPCDLPLSLGEEWLEERFEDDVLHRQVELRHREAG